MDTEFSIKVKSIEIETDENGTLPTWALIELTINGMPATFCPSIRPDDEGRLRLYPRDPGDVRYSWGADDAWEVEVYPALEKHMHEDWDEDDFWEITEEVNDAVYTACNAELKDFNWQDEYELFTPEQRKAAEILAGPWHVFSNCAQVRVEKGYAVVTQDHRTLSRTPITPDVATRVIKAGSGMGFGSPAYNSARDLEELIDAVENIEVY